MQMIEFVTHTPRIEFVTHIIVIYSLVKFESGASDMQMIEIVTLTNDRVRETQDSHVCC